LAPRPGGGTNVVEISMVTIDVGTQEKNGTNGGFIRGRRPPRCSQKTTKPSGWKNLRWGKRVGKKLKNVLAS